MKHCIALALSIFALFNYNPPQALAELTPSVFEFSQEIQLEKSKKLTDKVEPETVTDMEVYTTPVIQYDEPEVTPIPPNVAELTKQAFEACAWEHYSGMYGIASKSDCLFYYEVVEGHECFIIFGGYEQVDTETGEVFEYQATGIYTLTKDNEVLNLTDRWRLVSTLVVLN